MINQRVEVNVGYYSDLAKVFVTILEQIGNGFLARSEDGLFCSVHYDFSGQLHTCKLFDSEDAAREIAEQTRGQMA